MCFTQMKRFFLITVSAVWMITGCGKNTDSGIPDPVSLIEEMVETESEAVPERPLWEVMGEDLVLWAETFDPEKVESMTYEMQGENMESYTVSSAGQLQEFFEALDQITVSEVSEGYASDIGDSFRFKMKDGTEVAVEFCLSCFAMDRTIYETQNAEQLWNLTSQLLEERNSGQIKV